MAHGQDELWVSQQPVLLLYYLGTYLPRVSMAFTKLLGPSRVKVFKQGGDDYDIVGLIKEGMKKD